jgi:ketosteroid isomerase-like protein
MKGLALFVLGALIGLIIGALWIGPERVGELSDEGVAAINGAIESYSQAFMANDWPTFATHYAEDAVAMPPNAPAMQGRAAIRELAESWPTITAFSPTVEEIDGCRDLAFLSATYSLAAMPEGAPEPWEDNGKYVEIWRRQPDGSWLIAVEIWNSDNPPPVPGEAGE